MLNKISHRSANLSWESPGISGGLIIRYTLHASPYTKDRNSSQGIFGADQFIGEVKGLQPATQYLFQIEAFTRKGSIMSDGVNGTTENAGNLSYF